jgi:cytochrome c5
MARSKRRLVLLIGIGFAGCCAIYAAQAGSTAPKAGGYEAAALGSIHQAATRTLKENSSYEASSYPLFAATLAEGEGLAETESFCGMCHSTRYIVMQPPLAGDTWAAEVTKMVKTYGAPIPAASTQKIVLYLQTHYTPETRRQ